MCSLKNIASGYDGMPSRCRARKRRAFTLLEIALVLSLIVIAFSMALPRLKRPLASQRLSTGADRVRTAWTKARLTAMRNGETYSFRCDQWGSDFRVEPLYPSFDSNDTASYEPSATSFEAIDTEFRLPDGVTFSEVDLMDDARSALSQSESETDTRLTDRKANWSNPIFFYPDGTTTSAELTLAGEYNEIIKVTLRGVTGTARIQELQISEETR